MDITITVVSDTHGNMDFLTRVIKDASPFNMIIHCGDGIKDICSADIPENTTILRVRGNTDLDPVCGVDDILIEKISGRTMFIAHGHQYNVKSGLKNLMNEAINMNAAVVIFGHTHEPFFKNELPLLFNPGSLSDGYYGIIRISQESWFFEHKKIK